jgi:formate-dependent nitrite reductase membrane component NrfD
MSGTSTGQDRWRRRRRGEQANVPDAQFTSYYGKPVINAPVWKAPDIAGYLFLGGLAGASSVVAAGAHATARPTLARASKLGAFAAISGGAVALVHDLGKPARFVNMLRTFKPTSPMSVGSWLLAAYGPMAAAAAGSAATGRLPAVGAGATAGAGMLGPLVAAYTAALISDTAVPAWHEAHREMPYLFVASAASAAGGLGMVAAPLSESAPARYTGLLGAAAEIAALRRAEHRLGPLAEPYRTGNGGRLVRAAEQVSAASIALGLVAGGRNRAAAVASGTALLAGSALMRFGIFAAGIDSANDPRYTVEPQRARLNESGRATT